jgi:single-strand DNA-binding protein
MKARAINSITKADVNENVHAANTNNANEPVLIKKEVINTVTLTGNLGSEPEITEMTNGIKKAKFRMATNRYYKNKQGEWQSETSWHNVIAWGKLAVQAQKSLEKGAPACIEGKLNYRMFTDKNGITRFYSEIIARSLTVFPKKEIAEQKIAA